MSAICYAPRLLKAFVNIAVAAERVVGDDYMRKGSERRIEKEQSRNYRD
jgi:hypothetical protein